MLAVLWNCQHHGTMCLFFNIYFILVFKFVLFLFVFNFILLCDESDAFLTALCNYTLGGNVKVPVDSRNSSQTRIFLISHQTISNSC